MPASQRLLTDSWASDTFDKLDVYEVYYASVDAILHDLCEPIVQQEAPSALRVELENPHGRHWRIVACGKAGDYDREHFGNLMWIRWECDEGFQAEYFGPDKYAHEGWALGNN